MFLLLHRLYIFLRNLWYIKYVHEVANIKNEEYIIFSNFSGYKRENFQKSIDEWNKYVSENRVSYDNLDKNYSLCNLITNIEDQYSRVNLYKNLKLLINKFNRKINYLDFGCGSGVMSFIFIKYFSNGYFLDLPNMSQEYLRYKIRRSGYKNNLHILIPQKINEIKDNSLDIILLYDVLEHLHNPSEILKEIHPKLKVDGYLLFRAPWGDTIFGKHPDHNIFSRKKFIEKTEGGAALLKKKYKKIKSVSLLDFYYRQGIFKKINI